MVFRIETGATILGSSNLPDYRSVEDVERRGRSEWYASLILGDKVRNIEISGHGVVNGNKVFNPEGEEEMRGPHAIFFNKSEDITIRDLRCPVWMSLLGSFSGRSQDAAIRNVQISNLTATGVGKPSVASLIQGSADRPIENILLTNITIQSVSEGSKDRVDNPVPERVGDPVELPNCYGMYCRYIKDLEMHNIRFSTMKKDERPALICERVDRLEMISVRGPEDSSQEKSLLLKDIKILRMHQPGTAEK